MDAATAAVIVAGVTALATIGAASAAAIAIGAQRKAQRRQHDLENIKWLYDSWRGLLPIRTRAARQVLVSEDPWGHELRDVLNFLETVGYLVRKRYIDLESVEHTIAQFVIGWREAAAPVIDARLRATGISTGFRDLD